MNILCISAHPDDETLGCGGTLLRHRKEGDSLHWLICTKTYRPQWTAKITQAKAAEVQKVAKAYGMKSLHKLGHRTVQLDRVPQHDLMQGIRRVIEKTRPHIIYLVHGGDVHSDHQAVFHATMSVLKPFYMRKFGVRRILSHEILSSTEAAPSTTASPFIPNVFCDITLFLEQKIRTMALYESEKQPDLMPRDPSAIRALARYRGATIAVGYAEAFMLVREVL